jgi:tetratricopeptide (TPR) repeat protein
MKKIFIIFCLIIIVGVAIAVVLSMRSGSEIKVSGHAQTAQVASSVLPPPPSSALLDDGGYYVVQSFNNCGPAALSMDLSFYGVHADQKTLTDILRPDNNTTGKGDDKSTPPDEIAAQAETYGLTAYFRPNGSIDLLKRLVAAGFPVITRTLFKPSEDFAHYRVVKGYDSAKGTITEEDGFQGENVTFSYDDFLALWKPFNYEYIVLAAPDKQAEVESILGKDLDGTTAWQEAAQTAKSDLAAAPGDTAAEFNLSVADYHTGDYADSAQAFEQAEPSLSEHALWYQMEPIESYYELGDYDKVFSLAKSIFSDNNLAYPELYVLEGESYLKEGDTASAKTAFETALQYNKNLKSAQDALASISS